MCEKKGSQSLFFSQATGYPWFSFVSRTSPCVSGWESCIISTRILLDWKQEEKDEEEKTKRSMGAGWRRTKKKKNDAWRVAWKGLKIALHTPRSAPRWLKKTNRRKREKKMFTGQQGWEGSFECARIRRVLAALLRVNFSFWPRNGTRGSLFRDSCFSIFQRISAFFPVISWFFHLLLFFGIKYVVRDLRKKFENSEFW